MSKKDIIKKASSWYFSKRMLPYWVIMLADAVIVFLASIFSYWVANAAQLANNQRSAVLVSSLLYAALSWVIENCSRFQDPRQVVTREA